MIFVRLILALVLAAGFALPHGSAMAADRPGHVRGTLTLAISADRGMAPCENSKHDQTQGKGCQTLVTTCCALSPILAGGELHCPLTVDIAWYPIVAVPLTGLGSSPETPPPRV